MDTLTHPKGIREQVETPIEKRATLTIPADLHRELKIASAHRNEEIRHLIRRAWEAFKKAEGKRLHNPVSGNDAA